MPATLPRQGMIALGIVTYSSNDPRDPLAVIDMYGQRIEVALPTLASYVRSNGLGNNLFFRGNTLANGDFVICCTEGLTFFSSTYRAVFSSNGVLLSETLLPIDPNYVYVDRYGTFHIIGKRSYYDIPSYMTVGIEDVVETNSINIGYNPRPVTYGRGGFLWTDPLGPNSGRMFWHINGAGGVVEFGAGMHFDVLGGVIQVHANHSSGPCTFRTIANPSVILFADTIDFSGQITCLAQNERHTLLGRKAVYNDSGPDFAAPLTAAYLIDHINGTRTTLNVGQWHDLQNFMYYDGYLNNIVSQGDDTLFVMEAVGAGVMPTVDDGRVMVAQTKIDGSQYIDIGETTYKGTPLRYITARFTSAKQRSPIFFRSFTGSVETQDGDEADGKPRGGDVVGDWPGD